MTPPAAQAPIAGTLRHLVLYDGVCALCQRLVRFLLAQDRRGVFAFASLQSDVGHAIVERHGGTPGELTTFVVVADVDEPGARLMVRGRAALFVLRELGWPWKLAAAFNPLPTILLDRVYDAIARSRYRLFGRADLCLVPRPELARRFLDRGAVRP